MWFAIYVFAGMLTLALAAYAEDVSKVDALLFAAALLVAAWPLFLPILVGDIARKRAAQAIEARRAETHAASCTVANCYLCEREARSSDESSVPKGCVNNTTNSTGSTATT
jgi:hypothetical protein